jgi:bifunctional DNase/RNase
LDKIELEIIALSQNVAQTHSYAIILGEINGLRRLPIVIGGFEAQAIAVSIENMTPSRPLTHDLMKSIFDSFSLELLEVVIDNLVEGVFYSKLICKKDGLDVEIDSRTSDAIALAVRFKCPIYTRNFILENAGIIMSDEVPNVKKSEIKKVSSKEKSQSLKTELQGLSDTELEEKLQQFLENEEYEKAAKVRDEISKRSAGN